MVFQKLGSWDVIGRMGTTQVRKVSEMVGRDWNQGIGSASFGSGGCA